MEEGIGWEVEKEKKDGLVLQVRFLVLLRDMLVAPWTVLISGIAYHAHGPIARALTAQPRLTVHVTSVPKIACQERKTVPWRAAAHWKV
eukprot:3130518-Rhodomonas_salina.3